MPKCNYTSSDGRRCPEEASDEPGRCIFHTGGVLDAPLQLDRFEKRLTDGSEFIRFDEARFVSELVFKDRIYDRSISFKNAQFHANTSFEGAEFRGWKTVFDGATFRENTNFKNVKFHAEETSFEGTKFLGSTLHMGPPLTTTSFDKSDFKGKKTSFKNAEFSEENTSFKEAQFRSENETSFGSVKFSTEACFYGSSPIDVFYSEHVIFNNITFIDQIGKREFNLGWKGKIKFKWANLAQTEFLNTDLSKIDFINVEWNHQCDSRALLFRTGAWRSKLRDEMIWRDKRKREGKTKIDDEYLTWMDKSYRTLKDYYRQEGVSHLMGHFHYGVMDIRFYNNDNKEVHKGTCWLKRKTMHYFSWLYLYKITSGYGEDSGVAGRMLILLILFFGSLFWLIGVPSPQPNEAQEWWRNGLNAILCSFQAGTFSKIEFYKVDSISLCGRILHLTESILVPTQFAFFIIALRNSFRR